MARLHLQVLLVPLVVGQEEAEWRLGEMEQLVLYNSEDSWGLVNTLARGQQDSFPGPQ